MAHAERPLRPALILAFLFFSFLFYHSYQLISNEHLQFRDNVLFQADIQRTILNTASNQGYHPRTSVHPLFLILVHLPGSFLSRISHLSPWILSIVFTSLCGSMIVVFSYLFFMKITASRSRAVLYALIVGLTSSHFFFSLIPETFIFAAASLVLFYALLASFRSESYLAPAAVLVVGVTVTNFIPALLSYLLHLPRNTKLAANKMLRFAIFFITFLVLVNLAQIAFYPFTEFVFFQNYKKESKYIAIPKTKEQIYERAIEVTQNVFVNNVVAPKFKVQQNEGFVGITFSGSRSFWLMGYLGLSLWSFLFVAGIVSGIKNRVFADANAQGLLVCVIFNFVLHFFFGDELFLYTCHWTFAIVGLALLSFDRMLRGSSSHIYTIFLVVFICVLLWNDLQFYGALRQFVSQHLTR